MPTPSLNPKVQAIAQPFRTKPSFPPDRKSLGNESTQEIAIARIALQLQSLSLTPLKMPQQFGNESTQTTVHREMQEKERAAFARLPWFKRHQPLTISDSMLALPIEEAHALSALLSLYQLGRSLI